MGRLRYRQKLLNNVAKLIVLASLLLCASPFAAQAKSYAIPINLTTHATQTTIAELNEGGEPFHGTQIEVTGEVVGDIINNFDGQYWLTLNDKKSAISVLVTADMASQIDRAGNYQVTGTIVKVSGSYHVACEQHFGPSDIHATKLEVVSASSSRVTPADFSLFAAGLVFALVGGILTLIYRMLKERSR
jgi:hypothetical protein